MGTTILSGAALFDGHTIRTGVEVHVEAGIISAITQTRQDSPNTGSAGASTAEDTPEERAPGRQTAKTVENLTGQIIIPGFVDMHCHGGAGADFTDPRETHLRKAAATHARTGTTTLVASLPSLNKKTLYRQLATLRPLVKDHTLAGIHLEGPWINPEQAGAHPRHTLTNPDRRETEQLLNTHGDIITMITLAPELPGAQQMIRQLVEAGITVAIGHTTADYETTQASIEAGARVATHLGNKMPHLHRRKPGVAGALLENPHVYCELILDGHHLHPGFEHILLNALGPRRACAITDACAGAAAPDGKYRLGELDITVQNRKAVVTGTKTLAGSTLTMNQTLARLVTTHNLDMADAAAATSTTPAHALGLKGPGTLQPGGAADLIITNTCGTITAVMKAGQWLHRAKTSTGGC